jgi:hypothetical protein
MTSTLMRIVLLLALGCCLAASVAFASGHHPAPPASFENSPGWAKIDLRFREAWKQAIDAGERSKKLGCMMKLARPATESDKGLLRSAGFAAHTTIGAILTGSVAAGRLPDVANLAIVQAMELATPLSPKPR